MTKRAKPIALCEKHGSVPHYTYADGRPGSCVYCVSAKKLDYYEKHHEGHRKSKNTKYSSSQPKSASTRSCKHCLGLFDHNVTYDGVPREKGHKRGVLRHFCSRKCQGDYHVLHRFDEYKDGQRSGNVEYALNKLGIFRTKERLDAFDRLSGWLISHLVEKSMDNVYTADGVTYTLRRNGLQCHIKTSHGKKAQFEHRDRVGPIESDFVVSSQMGRPKKNIVG